MPKKQDGTFKDEEDFKKKMGMTPLEFSRFIRTSTKKEVDKEIKKLMAKKKAY